MLSKLLFHQAVKGQEADPGNALSGKKWDVAAEKVPKDVVSTGLALISESAKPGQAFLLLRCVHIRCHKVGLDTLKWAHDEGLDRRDGYAGQGFLVMLVLERKVGRVEVWHPHHQGVPIDIFEDSD